MTPQPRKIELLAPARDAGIGIEAIAHGADAVYMGAARFGARAAAGNSVDDIARVCNYAHRFNARVYATVNTIVYDHELRAVERLTHDLYAAGVDALIVQDMALLRLDLPPIALHASTQCDLRTPAKARFLQAVGFSQLVMARELTLTEIAAIRDAVDVPLEAFVHGALCVSYSGRCQVSQLVKQRSANRGECAQVCRLPYDLLDGDGRVLMRDKHLLSLRDLNRSDRLDEMLEAGVSSFKIEGRLKDAGYVKNVVAHYRRLLDAAIARGEGRYERLSCGTSRYTFTPDASRSFNRSFTHYFCDERRPQASMASIHTPKSQGLLVGRAVASRGNELTVNASELLVNGDGLSYFDRDGVYTGVRVNRVVDNTLVLRERVDIRPGTLLYRTTDKALDDLLSRPSAQRTIAVDAVLTAHDGRLSLVLDDERGNCVERSIDTDLQPAATPQDERQRTTLAKLGGTGYSLRHVVTAGDVFVPASVLTTLRRDAIAALDEAQRDGYVRDDRRPEDREAVYPEATLMSADNVANSVARAFYRDHGVTAIEPAVERGGAVTHAMHTRYCLRRELGACPRIAGSKRLPAELYLRSGSLTMKVNCDCRACEMTLEVMHNS